MSGRGRIIGALSLALFMAGGGAGAEPLPAQAPVRATALPVPAPFDFARYTDARFIADRRAGIDAMAAAQTPAALYAAQMDLAEVFLAHLMLPEARGLLDRIPAPALDPAGQSRLGALSVAVALMSGQDPGAGAGVGAAASPLVAADAGWRDQPFWAAIAAVNDRDLAGMKRNLTEAFARLDSYPRVYAETCLPMFLKAALDSEQWDLAKRIAERFDVYPDLSNAAVYPYLLGRAAEGVRRPDRAMEAYARAAERQGPDAQRAIQAMVDLGLARNSLTPENAQKLLQRSLSEWQGGDIELGTLRRLAHVDRLLGDWPGMLVTLGQLLRDYPNSPDADPARKQAESLIVGYYTFALAGKLPLDQLLRTHRQITPLYRLDDVFEQQAQALADHMLKLGVTAMAAQEYGRIHDALSIAKDLSLYPVAPERLAGLRLAQAGALEQGGQYEAAARALAEAQGVGPQDQDRLNALNAQVYAGLGELGKVVDTRVAAPSANYLRLLGQSYLSRKDWARAEAQYQTLWQSYPKLFGQADAINLMLAAFRAGDRATAEKVVNAFPQLGAGAQSPIAAGILKAPAPLDPLKQSAADARLNSAQDIIDRITKADQAMKN